MSRRKRRWKRRPNLQKKKGKQDEKDKDKKDETEIDDGDDEDVRKPRVGRRTLMNTKVKIAGNDPLHLKYKSGCAHCRAGKARLAPHLCELVDREEIGIAAKSDYAFTGSEESDENT